MKVIVHLPSNKNDKDELKKKVAEVHGDSVAAYIKKQPWTKEQKLLMIKSIADKCS
ncbi:MAG: hypothetical protein OSJ54_09940 [Oscillospiraceae bacterium]|nr:hypothetical protein [Oscillospiraceae bacterium]